MLWLIFGFVSSLFICGFISHFFILIFILDTQYINSFWQIYGVSIGSYYLVTDLPKEVLNNFWFSPVIKFIQKNKDFWISLIR